MKTLLTIFVFISFVYMQSPFAQHIVDVYGTTELESSLLIKKYSKEIIALENNPSSNPQYPTPAYIHRREQLINTIKQTHGYAFVNLERVYYPDQSNDYTTIDVIKPNQLWRMRYVPKSTHTTASKNSQIKSFTPLRNDLINTMVEFSHLEGQLMMSKQLDPQNTYCPVYHCVSGFNHPKLKPYLQRFNQGARQHRQLIVNTLKHDLNSERRQAAAFLIGHFKNPRDILAQLLPYINDSDYAVRNNAIRVIGSTLYKEPRLSVDIRPFIQLLNSPYLTDRNKALFVLYTAATTPMKNKLIYKYGRYQLIDLLALKQPNNHDIAYLILKKISGQTYRENDFIAWKKWAEKSHLVFKS